MPTSPESLHALDLIRTFAAEQEVAVEEGTRPGELVLTLPGENKLRTTCSLIAGGRMLSISAFVIRNPDENHSAVYRFLLQRNLSMPVLSYALDDSGDVYLTGQVPISTVDEEFLDQLLGIVLAGTDEVFNELLVLGFLGSMRKEWSWRVSREESLANLEPFRELLQRQEDEGPNTLSHESAVDEEDAVDNGSPRSEPAGEDDAEGPTSRP
ncbi:type III secretion system chaperone family protein [Mobilicoccus massiliensis]|uniref:YbjN domain-containing protein n=1 Tax=Mobilicoccus massiliensis TaxID=1522310 RepID=UPI0009E30B2C|nr:YbjN domain-containing protein [Mobilicoccus massiliensis]